MTAACLVPSGAHADPVERLIARRRRALAAWEAVAARVDSAGEGSLAPVARLLGDERRHVARLARELPAIHREAQAVGDAVRALATEPGAPPAAGVEQDSLVATIDLLASALADERCLQSFCERLAVEAADPDLRLRALSLALAVSRHLQGLQAELARLHAKL